MQYSIYHMTYLKITDEMFETGRAPSREAASFLLLLLCRQDV